MGNMGSNHNRKVMLNAQKFNHEIMDTEGARHRAAMSRRGYLLMFVKKNGCLPVCLLAKPQK